ncbi:MAG: DUF4405 domain-containing protein [Porticoccus sp.]|nr:DUF4405 domain-containing protein [Porticoccus sp.]
MNQFTVIKILDLLSFAALTLMLSTGIFLRFTLPPRSGGDEVWGLTRHDWGNIHYYLSVVFLLFMSAHLVAHAKFIKSVIIGKATKEKYYRIAIGILGVIALIALAFTPVVSPVTDAQRGHQYYNHNK